MRPRVLVLLTVLMITAASYAGLRQNGWVYEDYAMQDVAAGGGLNLSDWTAPSRNLSRLSVGATSWLSDKTAPSHHAASLVLHLINGSLVAILAESLLGGWGAILAATVFLWAPIQVETAGYIASRPDLLMTFFFLLALITLRVGAWHWLRVPAVMLCALGACYCKQTGFLIGPLIWLFWPDNVHGRWPVGLGLGGIAMALLANAIYTVTPEHLPYDGFSNVAYQAAAWWRMVSLVFMPWGLSIDHNIAATPTAVAWLALCALVGVVLGALTWLRGTQQSALLWVAAVILPSMLLRMPEFFNEHKFYSAMIGVSLLIGSLLPKSSTEQERFAWA